jgi:cell division septation protein DedD
MARTSHASRRFFLLLSAAMLLWQALPFETAYAQARRDISVLVTQAKAGAEAEVAKLLPALQKSHPDKAGVLFLEALLESDAEKAVELYQRVADEYPSSEWSDDALYRLYQYSFAVGAYRTARSYTERIEKDYPQSPFLTREQRVAAKESAAVKEKSTTKEIPATKTTAKGNGESRAAVDGGSYAIQVGAYSREADARKQIDELKTKGYTAYLREKNVNGKKVQAVWLGIFPDFAQAQAFAQKMKEQQNMDVIVVRR